MVYDNIFMMVPSKIIITLFFFLSGFFFYVFSESRLNREFKYQRTLMVGAHTRSRGKTLKLVHAKSAFYL